MEEAGGIAVAGTYKIKDTSTSASCVARRESIAGVETACKSVVVSELYTKLQTDNRLDRFLALIQYCSSEGKTVDQLIEFLFKTLPGYLNSRDFNATIFKAMCKNHSDVSAAWGFGCLGDAINMTMIKNRAVQIAMETKDIGQIKTFKEMYDTVVSEQSKPPAVRFTLELKQSEESD